MKILKKLIILSLIAVFITSMIVGCGTSVASVTTSAEKTTTPSSSVQTTAASASTTTTLKIASSNPLTGSSAEQGTYAQRGGLLAIEDANAAGGINGVKLEQVACDDRGDPKEAATVANRIAADTSILAVIGNSNSSCTLAGAPIYNKAGIVQISPVSSSPAISDAGPYTFRVWNSDTYTADFNVQSIITKGYKNIGIIYSNNDYGVGANKVAIASLEKAGLKVLVDESFLLGETKDFSTILTKMKDAKVEAMFVVADEADLGMIAQQAHALNFTPFISSTGTYSQKVIDIGKKDVEGMYGATLFNPTKLPEKVSAFFDKYKARFGEANAPAPAVTAYIATSMIIDALKHGAKTREDIKNYLTTLKNFDSMVGSLSFDANGDTVIPLTRITIKDGKFVAAE